MRISDWSSDVCSSDLKDYLATRVAFKLGLRGPAMTLQTACSTSLVAIVNACQSIASYQCDMALAGGVTIVLPQRKRSEEHTSELQSLMRISYAVFCLKKKKKPQSNDQTTEHIPK